MAVPLLFFPKEESKPFSDESEIDPTDKVFNKIVDVRFIRENSNFHDCFVITHTLYCSPQKLMTLILQKFEEINSDESDTPELKLELSLLTVFLEKWMNLRFHDFFEIEELENEFKKITNKYYSGRKKGSLQKMVLPLKQFWEELRKPLELGSTKLSTSSGTENNNNLLSPYSNSLSASSANISPSTSSSFVLPISPPTTIGISPSPSIEDSDSYFQKIAEQLTIIEWKLLKRIHPSEYIGQAWSKKHKEIRAPNLVASIDWFNRMSLWYSTCIVREKTPEARAGVICNCITIGKCFAKLNNFNGVIQILSSLHSSSINRLRRSWKLVSRRSMNEFEELGALMNPKLGWKVYRETLSKTPPPYIPYLGMSLTDLTFLDDCKENFVNRELNYEKIEALGRSILPLLVRPHNSYELDEDASLMKRLLNDSIWDENSIYNISKLHEDSSSSTSTSVQGPEPSSVLSSFAKNFENLSAIGQTKVKTNSERTDLSKKDWSILLAKAPVKSCTPGEQILSPTSENFYLYRVKTGKLSKYNENEVKISEIITDDMFGEMSILDINKPNPYIIKTDTPTELYRLDVPTLVSIFSTNPNLAKKFYRLVACRLAKQLKAGPNNSTTPSTTTTTTSSTTGDGEISPIQEIGKGSQLNLSVTRNRENKEERIRSKLGIREPEIIVKEYNCILKSGRTHKKFGMGGVLKETISPSGTLYLFQSYLAFFAQVFHVEFKICLQLRKVSGITLEDDMIIINDKLNKMTLKFKDNVQDVYAELATVWESAHSDVPKTPRTALRDHRERSRSRTQSVTRYDNQYDDPLTPDDWEIIMRSAKHEKYQQNEVILQQGQQFQRIHQIAKGNCRIEKMFPDKDEPVVLGSMRESETFGEVSFLEGGGAAVSIIADSPEVEVYIIEGYYINMLFEMRDPGFASRFYHYLCIVLAHHITKSKS